MSAGSSLLDQAFSHHLEGRFEEAEALYRSTLESDSENFQALQLLGTLALRTGRIGEALSLLEHALAVLKQRGDQAKRHAALYANIGIALRASKRSTDAIAHFEEGLKLDPELTELHVSLGGARMEQGDFAGAERCFETALAINPNLPGCLCDLGTVYAQSGRLADAIVTYRRALAIEPKHWAARINLAQMLRRTGKYDEAIETLTQLLQDNPSNALIHGQLGMAYVASERLDLALDHFRRVLAQKPDDAEALQYIANIQQALGQADEADRNYRRSFELRPLITIAATQSPPAFRVLLLFAPGAGNTPLDCVVDCAAYENNILNLLPGAQYDIERLRSHADVVVNLIADVDQSTAVLAPACELINRIGKPVVNHPRKIMQTGRDAVAERLAGTPGCLAPKTKRYAASTLREPDFIERQKDFVFPFLVRPIGTHGGVDFEKIENIAAFDAFIGRHATDCYLTDYVDFRSADGYFRKYRFIFVGDDILPYHLAIDDKWKIHHVTTNMANQRWMQEEERSFLENPHTVFGPAQYDALRAIRRKIDLDYFGIDCALDEQSRIVVFEVNACMLVHQHNEQFPYKTEYVNRISIAFDALLKRMASSAAQRQKD